MPSKLYLKGDSAAIWLNSPADQALSTVEDGRKGRDFVRLDMVPWKRGEAPKPAYFDPAMVAAILPCDPREYEAALDDLPDWLQD